MKFINFKSSYCRNKYCRIIMNLRADVASLKAEQDGLCVIITSAIIKTNEMFYGHWVLIQIVIKIIFLLGERIKNTHA